jgi:glycosyltransferase involved in cell wall biosynthesis
MRGGFVTLAEQADAVSDVDVVLVSDMLDLAGFLGMTRRALRDVPAALYMHENQLTYPWADGDDLDYTYPLINWTSMAVADAVFFNSIFHRDAFFAELEVLLGRFPDHRHVHRLSDAWEKTSVLPVGVELATIPARLAARADAPARILWNQRWEYDKRSDEFFRALYHLQEAERDFRVVICGENFRNQPEEFDEARRRLGDRVVHFGYAPYEEYVRLLASADIVVSTAAQEFFGIAITEAVFAGAFPLLPDRLVYPERIPETHHERCLYRSFEGLVAGLEWALDNRDQAAAVAADLRPVMARFDWGVVAPRYDAALEALV